MIIPRRVQNPLDFVRIAVAKVLVHGPDIVVHGPVDGQQGEEDDGFFVDDVDLVADGRNGETSSSGENGRL